jgi:hypothetical protein
MKDWNFKEERVRPTMPTECREGHHVTVLSCLTKLYVIDEVAAHTHVDSPLGVACQCVAQQFGLTMEINCVAQQLKLEAAKAEVYAGVDAIESRARAALRTSVGVDYGRELPQVDASQRIRNKLNEKGIVEQLLPPEPVTEHAKMVDFFAKDCREKK